VPDRVTERRTATNEARSIHVSAGPIVESLEARLLLSGTAAHEAIELFHITPAVFIENQGQWADSSVRFVHRGQGANIAHTDSGPVFELFREVASGEDDAKDAAALAGVPTGEFDAEPARLQRLRFSATFDGANAVTPIGLEPSQTRFNFFVGDPSEWRENVPSYEIVAYEGLYDGIDLHTWGRRDHLKYEFHVAPGADFSQIRVSYSGIEALTIDEAGTLHVRLPGDRGEVVDEAPYIYQVGGGEQVEVPGVYRLVDADTYAFEIAGAYDPTQPLIIDPDLDWSSYLGAGGEDRGHDIAVDAGGNVLVTGTTYSSGWVSGGWDETLSGGAWDGFVVKLSASGGHLWSSYLGGSGEDGGYGVAADAAGNALVTGQTMSSGWVSGGWDTNHGGGYDGFLVKLSPSGGHLWSSYLGGGSDDRASGIALDATGSVLVTGYTTTSGWVSGGWDTSYGGDYDAFVVKLSASGEHLWSSYVGDSAWEQGYGIAADAAGNALLTGYTWSLALASGGRQTSLGGTDAFVVKLSATGGHLWSRYLGGSGHDRGYGIAADLAGNALVTGTTGSPGWTSGGWQTSFGGDYDGFVVKLSAAGGHLWSSYLGGGSTDGGWGVTTDAAGRALVTGQTMSSGWVSGGWDTGIGGVKDAFVVKLGAAGGHLWSSYLGGGDPDGGQGIAADDAGNALVTGWTWSSGWVSGGWDTTYGGGVDGFVARIAVDTTAPTVDAWYSAGEHGEGVGKALLEIPDDGTFCEPRMAGVAELQVEFSEAIDPGSFTPESVRMAGNDSDGNPVDLSDIAVSTSTAVGDTVGIINFEPALPDAVRYLVQIEGVTDLAGNPLAGDNDRVFTALAGDCTGDLRVNAIDLSYIWPRRTTLIDGVSEDQTRSDVTSDGRINAIDLSAAWPRRGADMRDVPDPVLSKADASPSAEAGAIEAAAVRAALVGASMNASPASPAAWQPAQARTALAASPAIALRPAPWAQRPAASEVVTVPVETKTIEVAGQTPAAAVDALPDVLALSKLLPLAL